MALMSKSGNLSSYRFFRRLEALPFVEAIYLYGSRAREEEEVFSDIDLAIYCPKAGVLEWTKVRDIVEAADTLLEIDCVRLDTASRELRENILREGKRLYERPA